MHLLYDTEIASLGKKAEEFVLHQRKMKSLFKDNAKAKPLFINEDPQELAVFLLKDTHHLDGDIVRLAKVIKTNLQNMEWFHNKT